MANRKLFQRQPKITPADTTNLAGGAAYSLTGEEVLAQMACTGCLNNTFYATAENQLDSVVALASQLPAEFVAQTAIYASQTGFMKDLPALLLVCLLNKDTRIFSAAFEKIVRRARVLRTFIQILRSGKIGRKTVGSSAVRRAVQGWFDRSTDDQIFAASVGNDPSLSDVIKLAHPRSSTKERGALLGLLVGNREVQRENLPTLAQKFLAFKDAAPAVRAGMEIPDVPFLMLTSFDLTKGQWIDIARSASWQTTRMNLNTFARHRVFENTDVVAEIAKKLRDPDEIKRAKVFPYQLLAAFVNASDDVPSSIKLALQDAMEIATEQIPAFGKNVYVFVDVSGSMSSPITGARGSATTSVKCVDVASLFASAVLRTNPNAVVWPFDTTVHSSKLNPRDSVMTNSGILRGYGGGGTACSVPMLKLADSKNVADLIIYISDNESWFDDTNKRHRGTATLEAWERVKRQNPQAKLVCIDLTPNATAQVPNRNDVLNVGGFSDTVFNVIAGFVSSGGNKNFWVNEIKSVKVFD